MIQAGLIRTTDITDKLTQVKIIQCNFTSEIKATSASLLLISLLILLLLIITTTVYLMKQRWNNQQWELLYEVCSRTLNHALQGGGQRWRVEVGGGDGGVGGVVMNLRRSR